MKLGYSSHLTWVVLVTKWQPSLCNPMDYSLPGSSVHGISQARILKWATISYSWGGVSLHVLEVSCIGRQILYHWASRKAHLTRVSRFNAQDRNRCVGLVGSDSCASLPYVGGDVGMWDPLKIEYNFNSDAQENVFLPSVSNVTFCSAKPIYSKSSLTDFFFFLIQLSLESSWFTMLC